VKHRTEIDGLRAIAVIPVILFHAEFTIFSGGYVGVDVFFVISGYLITRVILNELDSGNFSITKFYERRVRRIFPALFFVVICCIPFAWFWMAPSQFKDFSQTIFAVSIFASNILFSYKHNYFSETTVDEKPLLHTWSLGVEEQFYILFPVALMMLWRFGRSNVFYLILIIAASSLAISEWGWRYAPNYNYYLATSRVWELLAGSICAFNQSNHIQKRNNPLSALGFTLIIISIFYYDEATPFPSIFTLIPVIGTCLVILYGADKTVVCRLLSIRAFVGVGLVSYSAYLWHQPLFAFARIKSLDLPEPLFMAFLSGLTFLLAYGSWKYIETPFRRKKQPRVRSSRFIFVGSAIFISGILAFGFYGHMSNGRQTLWEESVRPEISKMYRLISSAKTSDLHLPQDNGACLFNVPKLDKGIEKRLLDCMRKYGPGIAILGGSHAIDLFGAISSASHSKFIVGVTQGYCRPHNPPPFCQYTGFLDFVSKNERVFNKIIYEQTGRTLLQDSKGKSLTKSAFLYNAKKSSLSNIMVNQENLEEVYVYLTRLSTFTDVIWLGPRIEPHISERLMLKVGCDFKFTMEEAKMKPFKMADRAIRNKVNKHAEQTNLVFISQINTIKFNISRDFTSCQELYWSDGSHWSAHGEKMFGQRLSQLATF